MFRNYKRSLIAAGVALTMLALSGCSVLDRLNGNTAGAPDIQAELVKAFGSIDKKVPAGEGYVVVAPLRNGSREIGYITQSGGTWSVLGKRYALSDDKGTAELKPQGNMVVVQTAKDGAPQYVAYQFGVSGLQPDDYYKKIAPDATVKTGHFLLVNKQLNVMWHYQDGKLVKAYRVATGRQTEGPAATWSDFKTNFYTPEGNYKVTNLVTNPPFNALKDGDRSYAGGAPGNPLGTRWMGFTVLSNDNAWIWGIHGTSHPEQIGTWASDGCVRMYIQDAEELFALIKGQNPTLQIIKA